MTLTPELASLFVPLRSNKTIFNKITKCSPDSSSQSPWTDCIVSQKYYCFTSQILVVIITSFLLSPTHRIMSSQIIVLDASSIFGVVSLVRILAFIYCRIVCFLCIIIDLWLSMFIFFLFNTLFILGKNIIIKSFSHIKIVIDNQHNQATVKRAFLYQIQNCQIL